MQSTTEARLPGLQRMANGISTCPDFDPTLRQYQKFQFKPVLWEDGKARELPTFGDDPDGIALALNDKGQAVGASGTCTGFQVNGDLTYLFGLHATLWQNGAVTDLGNLGGIGSGGGNTAVNINNRSQVVGSSGTADGSFHAFLWDKDAGIQDLGTVQDDIASVGLGINDRGDVVGYRSTRLSSRVPSSGIKARCRLISTR